MTTAPAATAGRRGAAQDTADARGWLQRVVAPLRERWAAGWSGEGTLPVRDGLRSRAAAPLAGFDRGLVLVAAALVLTGLVMVYSASI
ncbi:MAG: hypothetical protein ABI696_15005, partial [Rubrivivax sp.]